MTDAEAVRVLRTALDAAASFIEQETEQQHGPVAVAYDAAADAARAALRDTAPESVGVCASDTQPHRGEHPKRGGCRNWREVKP